MNRQKVRTPQFCIITPIAYLEQYASQSSMHLVLAHLVDTNEQYASFYASRNELKIIDNGAYELGESYPPEKLIELGHKCKAHVIVLPDYPGQPWMKTRTAAEKLIPEIKQAGFKSMYVPQAEVGNLRDWIASYIWAYANPDIDMIGVSILACPNALPHIPRSYARVVMTQLLIEKGAFCFKKYHHFLGLNSGVNLEIPALIRMGALDSCDSSNPVWSALNGHKYTDTTESYLPVTKDHLREVNFDEPLTHSSYIHNMIQHNIDMTLKLFDNNNNKENNNVFRPESSD